MIREKPSIGLAVSASRVLASRLEGERPGGPIHEASWDATAIDRSATLTAILRQLRAKHDELRTLHVALMPPLAEIRLVDLPPLEAEELRSVVAGDMARLLPVTAGRHAVHVAALPDRATPSARRLISVADTALVDDLLEAASTAGLRVASLGAASLAWERAARAQGARSGRWLTATHGGREDALRLGGSGIDGLRRRSSGHRDALENPLRLADDDAGAMLMAARFAAAPDAQCLWPESTYAERSRRAWRRTRMLAVAALLFALASGTIEWRSLRRSNERVAAARSSIAPAVTHAIARRDSLAALDGVLSQVRTFETGAPRWLSLLADLERALPDDATLLSLRAGGDTLTLTGTAERAAPVLEALTGAAGFRDVRADAPIRQEVEDGEVVAEHFTVSLRSRRGGPQ
jgi:hypothetical protein